MICPAVPFLTAALNASCGRETFIRNRIKISFWFLEIKKRIIEKENKSGTMKNMFKDTSTGMEQIF